MRANARAWVEQRFGLSFFDFPLRRPCRLATGPLTTTTALDAERWKTDRAILVWGETRSPSGKDLRMLLDTRRSRRPRVLLAIPATLVAAAALIGSPAALATPNAGAPQAAPTAATTQGIIMSDGRICNPRWGC